MCALPQIAQAKQYGSRRAYSGPIVVLSEKSKAWMDDEIEAALEDSPPLRVCHNPAVWHGLTRHLAMVLSRINLGCFYKQIRRNCCQSQLRSGPPRIVQLQVCIRPETEPYLLR
jgi:hypothetical protein